MPLSTVRPSESDTVAVTAPLETPTVATATSLATTTGSALEVAEAWRKVHERLVGGAAARRLRVDRAAVGVRSGVRWRGRERPRPTQRLIAPRAVADAEVIGSTPAGSGIGGRGVGHGVGEHANVTGATPLGSTRPVVPSSTTRASPGTAHSPARESPPAEQEDGATGGSAPPSCQVRGRALGGADRQGEEHGSPRQGRHRLGPARLHRQEMVASEEEWQQVGADPERHRHPERDDHVPLAGPPRDEGAPAVGDDLVRRESPGRRSARPDRDRRNAIEMNTTVADTTASTTRRTRCRTPSPSRRAMPIAMMFRGGPDGGGHVADDRAVGGHQHQRRPVASAGCPRVAPGDGQGHVVGRFALSAVGTVLTVGVDNALRCGARGG